ncbi:MAG: hypothetical protein ACI9J3_001316 [Parvicellaceae bacterium]|jgi:hypothetical protein
MLSVLNHNFNRPELAFDKILKFLRHVKYHSDNCEKGNDEKESSNELPDNIFIYYFQLQSSS